MPRWTHAIIHHSLTEDNETLPDVVAIRRFHTSYRQYGHILTPEEYEEKKEQGEEGLIRPWRDIGYQWVVEKLSDGRPWLIHGRSMMMAGAHTVQKGMNRRGIGICIVGNFDIAPPDEDLFEFAADKVSWLCRMYRIPPANVQGHREYASYKTCPGEMFDMEYFRERVSEYLNRWRPKDSNEGY